MKAVNKIINIIWVLYSNFISWFVLIYLIVFIIVGGEFYLSIKWQNIDKFLLYILK